MRQAAGRVWYWCTRCEVGVIDLKAFQTVQLKLFQAVNTPHKRLG